MREREPASTLLEPVEETDGAFDALLTGPVDRGPSSERIDGARIGRLVDFKNDGTVTLVTYAGQPTSAAVAARATLDLQALHIGRDLVLVFEHGNPLRPIIVGCLHDPKTAEVHEEPGTVDIDADGERLVVSAKDQLVLRCGKASITLTRSGKVLLSGTYVSNRSSGVLRLKGASVQIN